ncbi:protein SIEVE ELEMENT OCCLUSION B-like [Silene latifolia]|uniref:protein SIEVE ELEMENT OCCLUSION B-like n=1 Tax=Silene latifolia TaxID=37657 RepID=UPI003D77D73A
MANLINTQKDNQVVKTRQQVSLLKETIPTTSLPLMVTQYSSQVTSSVGGGRMLSNVVSEETKILKLIQATHSHDARGVDTAPIVTVVEDILQRATLSTTPTTPSEVTKELVADTLEEKLGAIAARPKGTMLEAVAVDIQKICCEFSCKCSGGDVHASTLEVLNILGNYSWDAKVVITLAAFAVTYGELWLVIHLGLANHPLAKSIAVLKQTPELSEITGVLKSQFATLNELLEVVLDVAKSLIEFSSLPSKYITPEDAPLATSMNPIAIATYWSIRSIIASGARITSNIGITSALVSSATEAWDLSSLTHKQRSLHDQLRQKLKLCYEHIEVKKMEEAYANLVHIYQTPQKDNLRLLKTLIYLRDDIKPLVKISPKKKNLLEVVMDIIHLPNDDDVKVERFNVDILKGKTVLLFISDLDVSEEELAILDKIYKESKRKDKEFSYEIVWIPLVDQMTKENEQKFKELQYKMSWYTLFHPSLLDAVSKRFIREYLGFAKKQIIVGIDSVGKETTRDAYHLILIWGNSAYPFTKEKVEELWKKETWKPDFLLASIIPEFSKWAAQPNTHVCIFGGEDIEWIRKFTTTVKEQFTKTGIKIEFVYIGKPNAKKAVERIIKEITAEKIAHSLPNVTSVTYFWTRLESMLYTRMQYSHNNVDNDNIIKQVMSVLSFGSGHEGWASIGKPGTTEIIQAKGDQIIASISKPEFVNGQKEYGIVGSISQIITHIPGNNTGFHCNRIELPSVAGAGVPTKVVCTDCHRPMEKYILYKCCTG